MAPDMSGVIGIDVGGTAMKAVIYDHDNHAVIARDRRDTPRDDGPDAIVHALLDFAADLVTAAARRGTPARAIGIAVPGRVDENRGVAIQSSNLGWRDMPIADWVADRAGLPATLGHDVRVGGVAEARVGAGGGRNRLFFLALGTGIAGAFVVDGKALPGEQFLAGEVGHLVVRPGGEPCSCGNNGCLETVAAGWALPARYAARSGTGAPHSIPEILARIHEDDAAREVWDEAVNALADALATVTTIVDPGLVVIGGGLSGAGDVLLTPLRERLAARLVIYQPPTLVTAALGDQAGAIGSALLAADGLGETAIATTAS